MPKASSCDVYCLRNLALSKLASPNVARATSGLAANIKLVAKILKLGTELDCTMFLFLMEKRSSYLACFTSNPCFRKPASPDVD